MPIEVRPATADRWSDLIAVFGRRGEDPSWCWCQLFLRPAAADNRDALHQEIKHAAIPPGLIAYVDDHPAGWTRVGPRAAFPGVTGNKALSRVLTADSAGVWWVTCFAVGRHYRRSGVARTYPTRPVMRLSIGS